MQRCLEFQVKWWEVLDDNTHISKGYGYCAEGSDLYAEKDNGEFIVFDRDPFKMSVWDFTKLPEDEFENVKELVELNKVKDLMLIHNKYKLSPSNLCCNEAGVLDNFLVFLKQNNP